MLELYVLVTCKGIYRALPEQAPEYMRDMPQERTNVQTLHATVSIQLEVPQSRLKGFEYCCGMLCQDLSLILIFFKQKVIRHICLNLLLIRCNLFSCIFVM